ncbi:MAG: hypothetical protein KAH12_08415, partial [Anaerolineales bacterium]|nr:hypothetical protein [Anaerolineales bacterium]
MKAMRARSVFALLMMAVLISSCQGTEAAVPEPTGENFSFEFFRDGYYQAVLPNWEDALEKDPDALHMVVKDGQFISINRYQNLPEIFAEQFLSYIEEDS